MSAARDIDAAVRALCVARDRHRARAARAPLGSHGRKLALRRAEHLDACAQLLVKEDAYGAALARRGLLGAGWRSVADAITEQWRKAEATKAAAS